MMRGLYEGHRTGVPARPSLIMMRGLHEGASVCYEALSVTRGLHTAGRAADTEAHMGLVSELYKGAQTPDFGSSKEGCSQGGHKGVNRAAHHRLVGAAYKGGH